MSSISQSVSSFPTGQSASSRTSPGVEDFFDLDDILASQQKVPCQFEQPVYRLGFLSPQASGEHILTGSKMELPLWLARVLGSRRRGIVKVDLPKQYRETQRDIMSADASVVDLYKQGPYFYAMGVKMLCFDHLERGDLARSLLEAFLNRFRPIMDTSHHTLDIATTPLVERLDKAERELFRTGVRAVAAFSRWERGKSHRMEASSVVQNRRKRRREETK